MGRQLTRKSCTQVGFAMILLGLEGMLHDCPLVQAGTGLNLFGVPWVNQPGDFAAGRGVLANGICSHAKYGRYLFIIHLSAWHSLLPSAHSMPHRLTDLSLSIYTYIYPYICPFQSQMAESVRVPRGCWKRMSPGGIPRAFSWRKKKKAHSLGPKQQAIQGKQTNTIGIERRVWKKKRALFGRDF